jgi:hypothetical protein
MLEAELLRYAKIKFERSGLVWFRVNNAPSLFNKDKKVCFRKSPMSGFPDLFGVTPRGTLYALELKTIKGKVAAHQKECIARINASNGIAEVARTFEEIDDFISRMMES